MNIQIQTQSHRPTFIYTCTHTYPSIHRKPGSSCVSTLQKDYLVAIEIITIEKMIYYYCRD